MLRSDELNVDNVNAALQHVKGLNLPEATRLVNKDNHVRSIEPRTLQIESTNYMVGNILGGEMQDQLDPKAPVQESEDMYEESGSKIKNYIKKLSGDLSDIESHLLRDKKGLGLVGKARKTLKMIASVIGSQNESEAPVKKLSAFEAVRNKHIRALAEAHNLSEFKDVLSEFKDDLKKKISRQT